MTIQRSKNRGQRQHSKKHMHFGATSKRVDAVASNGGADRAPHNTKSATDPCNSYYSSIPLVTVKELKVH